ncbi:[protein-PII] uridylyltransferase [Desulfothermus okinawensis JCM 13304]
MDLAKKLSKKLKEKRDSFKQLCVQEVVGLNSVLAYADDVISCISSHLKGFNFDRFCVVASGGLGRGEISFDSDLDLVFLYKNKLSKESKKIVESIISSLWDAGFEVGQQVSSVSGLNKLIRSDFPAYTSLLETKFLGGDKYLYKKFTTNLIKEITTTRQKRNFLKKLKEYREERIKQYGESIYLIEPNIKEGLGGMRDIHCIRWGGVVCLNTPDLSTIMSLGWINQDELQWLLNGYDFLWKTRIQLHIIGGNKKEQLSLYDQHSIAKTMGFSHGDTISSEEAFMRMYYTHTSRIKRVTNFFIDKLFDRFVEKNKRKKEKIIPGPFIVKNNLIQFKDADDVNIRPEILMEIFWNASKMDLKFHHETGRVIRENLDLVEQIRNNEKVVNMFFDILLNEKNSFDILKVMHETKFLDTFIPEFLHQRYRVQYDTYHIYTVDEHSLRTVKVLHELKNSEYSYLFDQGVNLKILFLAGLLHDIGKGYGKSHSKVGSKLAMEIGKRLFLTKEEIELLCFLVENHLLLAETALKRDLEDEKPVESCAIKIGSLKRLYMLFLLQIADSIATGDRAWNKWRKTLLEEIFIKVRNILKGETLNGGDIGSIIEEVKERVIALADKNHIPNIKTWLNDLSIRYLLSQAPEDIYLHYNLEKLFTQKRDVVLNLRPLKNGFWELVFISEDHPKLFDFITGVLWVNGVNVLAADIFTRRYNVAVDIITVENIPDPFNIQRFCERIKNTLKKLLSGQLDLKELYKKKCYTHFDKYRFIRINDRVVINEEASDFYTIIEVYTWERPGVLHTISKVLHEFDLNIKVAKISTPGEQVVDVFYVTTNNGEKIQDPKTHEKIKKALINALKELS